MRRRPDRAPGQTVPACKGFMSGDCGRVVFAWYIVTRILQVALLVRAPKSCVERVESLGRVVGWVQVEFNKAALSLSDAIPTEQRKAALNRLLKVCPAPATSKAHGLFLKDNCMERRSEHDQGIRPPHSPIRNCGGCKGRASVGAGGFTRQAPAHCRWAPRQLLASLSAV